MLAIRSRDEFSGRGVDHLDRPGSLGLVRAALDDLHAGSDVLSDVAADPFVVNEVMVLPLASGRISGPRARPPVRHER